MAPVLDAVSESGGTARAKEGAGEGRAEGEARDDTEAAPILDAVPESGGTARAKDRVSSFAGWSRGGGGAGRHWFARLASEFHHMKAPMVGYKSLPGCPF